MCVKDKFLPPLNLVHATFGDVNSTSALLAPNQEGGAPPPTATATAPRSARSHTPVLQRGVLLSLRVDVKGVEADAVAEGQERLVEEEREDRHAEANRRSLRLDVADDDRHRPVRGESHPAMHGHLQGVTWQGAGGEGEEMGGARERKGRNEWGVTQKMRGGEFAWVGIQAVGQSDKDNWSRGSACPQIGPRIGPGEDETTTTRATNLLASLTVASFMFDFSC